MGDALSDHFLANDFLVFEKIENIAKKLKSFFWELRRDIIYNIHY